MESVGRARVAGRRALSARGGDAGFEATVPPFFARMRCAPFLSILFFRRCRPSALYDRRVLLSLRRSE